MPSPLFRPARSWRLVLLAGSLALAGEAAAATIVVKKGGAHPTIQSGVDAAGGGDTVLVKSGVYRENVVVPAGKDGLRLKAAGKVVVDARAAGGAAAGPGIEVDSNGVRVQGFVIRNALSTAIMPIQHGHGVTTSKDGLVVKDCEITGCSRWGVSATTSNGVRIIGCELTGNGGGVVVSGDDVVVKKTRLRAHPIGAIEIAGNGALVASCRIDASGEDGIDVVGSGAVVQKNVVRDATIHGVTVIGAGAKVRDNEVSSTLKTGIHVKDSPGCRVEDNDVLRCEEYGIDIVNSPDSKVAKNSIQTTNFYAINVAGDGAEIAGNRVRDAFDYGIDAEGFGFKIVGNRIEDVSGLGIYMDGSGFHIAKNVIRRCSDGYEGVYVSGAAAGGTIAGNDISFTGGPGIRISSAGATGIVIAGNSVNRSCASDIDAAVWVAGSSHEIVDNEIRDSAADGIRLGGSNNDVVGNDVRNCVRDGIDVVSGSGNLIAKNVVRDCGAEGIENNGSSTTVNKNQMKGNRTDFANSGTGTESGNAFATGGWSTLPEID